MPRVIALAECGFNTSSEAFIAAMRSITKRVWLTFCPDAEIFKRTHYAADSIYYTDYGRGFAQERIHGTGVFFSPPN